MSAIKITVTVEESCGRCGKSEEWSETASVTVHFSGAYNRAKASAEKRHAESGWGHVVVHGQGVQLCPPCCTIVEKAIKGDDARTV